MQRVIARDTANNFIYTDGNEVLLKLNAEKRTRHLATIDLAQKALIMVRQSKHLLRKAQAYGFNHSMLQAAKLCDKIIFTCPEGTFIIPIADVLQYGDYLWFKTEGFERQLFLRIAFIQSYPQQPTV